LHKDPNLRPSARSLQSHRWQKVGGIVVCIGTVYKLGDFLRNLSQLQSSLHTTTQGNHFIISTLLTLTSNIDELEDNWDNDFHLEQDRTFVQKPLINDLLRKKTLPNDSHFLDTLDKEADADNWDNDFEGDLQVSKARASTVSVRKCSQYEHGSLLTLKKKHQVKHIDSSQYVEYTGKDDDYSLDFAEGRVRSLMETSDLIKYF
jgi:hypothetical protein